MEEFSKQKQIKFKLCKNGLKFSEGNKRRTKEKEKDLNYFSQKKRKN